MVFGDALFAIHLIFKIQTMQNRMCFTVSHKYPHFINGQCLRRKQVFESHLRFYGKRQLVSQIQSLNSQQHIAKHIVL